MTSLIKSKGGWKKIRTMHDYSAINNATANKYFTTTDPEEFETLKGMLNTLNYNIEEAYDECQKNSQKGQYSAASVPLCVCITAVQNHLINLKRTDDFKEIEDFIEDMKERFNKKNWEKLNEYMSRASLQFSDKSFDWCRATEERQFWNELFETIKAFYWFTVPDKDAVNDQNGVRFINSDMYKIFLKSHPECEEEINDFCNR